MATTMSLNSGLALNKKATFSGRVQSRVGAVRAAPRRQVTRALTDANLVISGATAASLALGRFVFLPFQRTASQKQGLPVQNGVPNAELNRFSQEQSNLLKSNDPAGFNVIDVLAWGSIGHALGYLALATNSLQAPHVPIF